jgi:hypothetical protein
MNPAIREQAEQVAGRVAEAQEALAAGVVRCTAASEDVGRVLTAYARFATELQAAFTTVLMEQTASLQALADLATVITLQDASHTRMDH